jgi:hypothetical protein
MCTLWFNSVNPGKHWYNSLKFLQFLIPTILISRCYIAYVVENPPLIKPRIIQPIEQPVHRQCYITYTVRKALLNNTMRNFLQWSRENKLDNVEYQSPDPYLLFAYINCMTTLLWNVIRSSNTDLKQVALLPVWRVLWDHCSQQREWRSARSLSSFEWTCRTKRIASPHRRFPLMWDNLTIHHPHEELRLRLTVNF